LSSKRNKISHPPERGHKVGTKRADKRWIDEHGEVWASRFECKVYESGKRAGVKIRKCDKGGSDTVSYHSKVRDGVCQSCQGTDIIKQRRYTPDLRVFQDTGTEACNESSYYVEAKGYMRAPQRALLRDLCKTGALTGLRFILQADYRATASLTIGGWIDKFLHCKWAVFNGEWPVTWNHNEQQKGKGAKTGNKRVRKGSVQREGT